MSNSRKFIADAAFVLALIAYVLAGTVLTPSHGDEFMQIAMARDAFYIARGEWNRLAYTPPVEVDTEQYLRLLNGTINKTLMGWLWIASGRTEAQLPGIYAWAMEYSWNVARGNVPHDASLHLMRWVSALFTALGVIPAFLIGWHLRLRSLAYPAAGFYALHPIILLNGRRAMMEGSLMFFSLLTMYWVIAMIVAEHSSTARGFMRRLPAWLRYVVLGILIALTVGSKHSGLPVAGAALLTMLLTGMMTQPEFRLSWQPVARVALAGLVAMTVWFALNPAYWNNPPGALQATLQARAELLALQSSDPVLGYKSAEQRIFAVVAQPFLIQPLFWEAASWAGVNYDQVVAYQNSAYDGWDWGYGIGLILTTFATFGLVTTILDVRKRDLIAWAISIWAAITIVTSLAIPLAFQRYYLPLMLVAIVLAANGIGRLLVRRSRP